MVDFITIGSVKGGVGKTTLSVAIADALASQLGRRVLVLDADQQSSISKFIVMAPGSLLTDAQHSSRTLAGAFDAVMRSGNVQQIMQPLSKCGNLWLEATAAGGEILLLPGSLAIRDLEHRVWSYGSDRAAHLLKQAIQNYCSQHGIDLVLADTQAGFGPVALTLTMMADLLLVPSIPDRASFSSLDETTEVLRSVATKGVPPARVVFTKVQPGFGHSKFIEDARLEIGVKYSERFVGSIEGYFLQRRLISILSEFPPLYQTFEEKYQGLTSGILRITKEVERILSTSRG